MQHWQQQTDGSLLRAAGDLRLIVQPVQGAARFILIREASDHPGGFAAMIASGHKQSVPCAMAAAEKMAGVSPVDLKGSRQSRRSPDADRATWGDVVEPVI